MDGLSTSLTVSTGLPSAVSSQQASATLQTGQHQFASRPRHHDDGRCRSDNTASGGNTLGRTLHRSAKIDVSRALSALCGLHMPNHSWSLERASQNNRPHSRLLIMPLSYVGKPRKSFLLMLILLSWDQPRSEWLAIGHSEPTVGRCLSLGLVQWNCRLMARRLRLADELVNMSITFTSVGFRSPLRTLRMTSVEA